MRQNEACGVGLQSPAQDCAHIGFDSAHASFRHDLGEEQALIAVEVYKHETFALYITEVPANEVDKSRVAPVDRFRSHSIGKAGFGQSPCGQQDRGLSTVAADRRQQLLGRCGQDRPQASEPCDETTGKIARVLGTRSLDQVRQQRYAFLRRVRHR